MILSRSFYLNPDVVEVAKQTIGKVLVTRYDDKITSGLITETEAYAGITDRASHAYLGRRTERTQTMYMRGGTAYIYLCYGIHSLFNIVTNEINIPHAVLIRGIIPLEGTEIMKTRGKLNPDKPESGYGPGKVSTLLGIHYSWSGIDLAEPKVNDITSVWLEDREFLPDAGEIKTGKRIGVDYAGEDAALPYRFTLDIQRAEKKIAAFQSSYLSIK